MKYGTAAGRRGVILDRLQADGFAATAALARDMAVSEMTIRRDLMQLGEEGALLLVRGGAALPTSARSSFGARQSANAEDKRRIAVLAARSIGLQESIAVDAGTTAHALVEALPANFAGCVVTSSIPAVQTLMDRGSGPRVIALGGELHGPSRACIGPLAVDGVRQLRVATFFLGAAAIDSRGVYVEADLERPTKLALMAIADRVVLLADHAKFRRSAPVLLCPPSALTTLITDRTPPAALVAVLRQAGVDVQVAGS